MGKHCIFASCARKELSDEKTLSERGPNVSGTSSHSHPIWGCPMMAMLISACRFYTSKNPAVFGVIMLCMYVVKFGPVTELCI